jgi:hypothetical protein
MIFSSHYQIKMGEFVLSYIIGELLRIHKSGPENDPGGAGRMAIERISQENEGRKKSRQPEGKSAEWTERIENGLSAGI